MGNTTLGSLLNLLLNANFSLTAQEFHEQDEIIKLRLQQLRREEQELTLDLEKLERERNLHIRETKRIQFEDQSRYFCFMGDLLFSLHVEHLYYLQVQRPHCAQ